MLIKIIALDTKSGTSKAGKPFSTIEVTYKNLTFNKTESSKITEYSPVFKKVVDMAVGEEYTIVKEKIGDFWNWTSVTQGDTGGASPAPSRPGAPAASAPASRGTYETPEERQKKQIFIVKQSSLGHAIELLSIGAKVPPSTELVIEEAQKFVDYVFAQPGPKDDVEVE